ncbi:lipoprotein [Mycoplasma feriruminatoris]|uniref:Lipoprotein (VlcI) n=1 Tax=Mycoplasma feriruminatoris TaxID=1179777 RepID=A0AAQ3HYA7_9MOLU|nr:lipoprotein [Mycoplasma feriruminatoris]WFQ95593.1 lipoprotein (VlcI) [Mycoplasma feriruminatoris]
MKKLLTTLGSIGLIATTSAAVVGCGGKTLKKVEAKKVEENKEETKKEEKKVEKTTEENKAMFPDQNLNLGAFFKDESRYDSTPQLEIKEKIAKLLNTEASTLTDLQVNYNDDGGNGTVKSTKYADTFNFTFSNTLDLGKFKKDGNLVSQTEVKKKLAKALNQKEWDLTDFNVTYNDNDGSGSVKSTKTPGTLKIKFTIE